jgi:hypothetical protein
MSNSFNFRLKFNLFNQNIYFKIFSLYFKLFFFCYSLYPLYLSNLMVQLSKDQYYYTFLHQLYQHLFLKYIFITYYLQKNFDSYMKQFDPLSKIVIFFLFEFYFHLLINVHLIHLIIVNHFILYFAIHNLVHIH